MKPSKNLPTVWTVILIMLEPVSLLTTEIDRCIISEDEISDDASSTLKQIRRQIGAMNDRVHCYIDRYGQWFTPHLSAGSLLLPCVVTATVFRSKPNTAV